MPPRQRRPNRRVLLLLAVALVVPGLTAGTSAASDPRITLGVYRGPGNVAAVERWQRWRGGLPPARVLDFVSDRDWSTITAPWFWVPQSWGQSPYRDRMIYSLPILPRYDSRGGTTSWGPTLGEGAAGKYNGYWRELGRFLVQYGQAEATLRLGWEMNGTWFRWNAGGQPGAFVQYYRQIVDQLRSVPGARFAFEWSPNPGRGTVAPERVYPGDDYVDYIGFSVYNWGWARQDRTSPRRWRDILRKPREGGYGLNWLARFARRHGKRIAVGEWGLIHRRDGKGGGDEPYFVKQLYKWIARHDVAYHIVFQTGDTRMDGRRPPNPKSARTFLRLYSRGSARTQIRFYESLRAEHLQRLGPVEIGTPGPAS